MVSTLRGEDVIDITETLPTVRNYAIWHNIFGNSITSVGEAEIPDDEDDEDDADEEEDEEDEDGDNSGDGSSEEGTLEAPFTLNVIDILHAEPLDELPKGDISHDSGEMNLDLPSETQPNPKADQLATSPPSQFSSSALSSPPPTSNQPATSMEAIPKHLLCKNDFQNGLGADDNRSIPTLVPSRAPILHSNRHSFTLLPLTHCPPTQCHNALRQESPHDMLFPRLLTDYDRLNMLACIPELSLVLVASQVGRVALCTITRPVDRRSYLSDIISMRLELVLPFNSEETAKIRPNFGLLGMAVAPMWGEREQMEKIGCRPRRFRLMLHYFNHTILSYELSRNLETAELGVL
jgi:hypothetical protein